MKICVEATGWFQRFTGGSSQVALEMDENASAINAAIAAGIPEDEIGFIGLYGEGGHSFIIDKSSNLKEGDRIKVYPSIIGG